MRKEGLHAFRDRDEVGARLALHVHDHGPTLVGPAGKLRVFHVVEHQATSDRRTGEPLR